MADRFADVRTLKASRLNASVLKWFTGTQVRLLGKYNDMDQSIRIRLKAFDHRVLDFSTREIVTRPSARGGPFAVDPDADPDRKVHREPLAARRQESREQFEIRTHKRVPTIVDPPRRPWTALMKLDLSAGVDVEIKI